MTTWQIILLILEITSLVGWFIGICVFFYTWIVDGEKHWVNLWMWLFIIPVILLFVLSELSEYMSDVWNDGGILKHHRKRKQERVEQERERKEWQRKQEEYKRIETAYLAGKLARTELPHVLDGVTKFEFSEELGIYNNEYDSVGDIVYVEREHSEVLCDFFRRHRDLRLYKMYRFVYLPTAIEEITQKDFANYHRPDATLESNNKQSIDSTYPIQYLVYQEDKEHIQHGMFYFYAGYERRHENHGANYVAGYYYPLHEGSDEEIVQQLDSIVKQIHSDVGGGALYSTVDRPDTKEGSSDEYADEQFQWVMSDEETMLLVEEVKERIARLKERGLEERLLMKLLRSEPKISRMVITKDYRILLPDYKNMEIKMEPLNKAVYLLFLKHPEGIVFKCLPDYREELLSIYNSLRPLGLTDRAVQSIEDVTNPCLNSINEKCARIRGAFVSVMDMKLAQHYIIYGWRGEAKKINLDRSLVIWE